MSRLDLEWPYIFRHTMRPALCAGLAIVTLSVAIWLHGKSEQMFTQLTANHEAVHEDYDELVEQRRIVDRYHRRYQRFYELGFIGRESRLDWVETMRIALAGLDLPRISYSIEPQLGVIAPLNSMSGGGNIRIRVSKAQIEMGLMHEIDLLRFFDQLQVQAPGLIRVEQCELSNVAEASRDATDQNLNAKCSLQIFSVATSDVQGGTL